MATCPKCGAYVGEDGKHAPAKHLLQTSNERDKAVREVAERSAPAKAHDATTKATGVPAFDKAKPEEPVFVLRAQDLTSPTVVCEWIKANIETAPHDKLRQALETALAMASYGRMSDLEGGYETRRKRAD